MKMKINYKNSNNDTVNSTNTPPSNAKTKTIAKKWDKEISKNKKIYSHSELLLSQPKTTGVYIKLKMYNSDNKSGLYLSVVPNVYEKYPSNNGTQQRDGFIKRMVNILRYIFLGQGTMLPHGIQPAVEYKIHTSDYESLIKMLLGAKFLSKLNKNM